MRRRQRRRLTRAIALSALWTGLLAMATIGAVSLDERYQRTRFVLADRTHLCPLAVSGTVITPMCSAMPGW